MASVVIAGDTSGTCTLQANAAAGTTVLDLPTTSGTLVSSGSVPAAGSTTQVQYNNAGVLTGSANMVFNGTTLTVNDLTDSSLTSGRVVYAGTAGNLTNNAGLTYDGTNLTTTGRTLAAGFFNSTNVTGWLVGATTADLYTNNGLVMSTTSAGLFQMNSGYGSVATAYGCRAWVNFDGTGTPAIRGSGNVSSLTDNGTGRFTVNFTNAMPDANYAAVCSGGSSGASSGMGYMYSPTVNGTGTEFVNAGDALLDPVYATVSVFR
jgi:hypothetical protein